MIKPKRNANHGGCPRESARLKLPWLGFIGRRSAAKVFAEHGIDVSHGMAWIQDRTVLADRYQVVVRSVLAECGRLPSPCG